MRKALVLVVAVLALMPACRKKQGPPDVAKLVAELQSDDLQQRGRARLTLISLGEQAAPALAAVLQTGEPALRLDAANILWAMGGRARSAVPALAVALDQGAADLQLAAAMALEQIGPGAEAAVPALTRALGARRDRRVRQAAAKALGAIGPGARAAVPALTRELRKGSWPEAEEAVRRIQGLAPRAPVAVGEAAGR
jgi:HEAT repeat protein